MWKKIKNAVKKVPKTVTGISLIVLGYVIKPKAEPVGEALIYIGSSLAGLGAAAKVRRAASGGDPFEHEKRVLGK